MKKYKIKEKKSKKEVKENTELRRVTGVFRATKKGYGFLEVSDENADTVEEIFIPASKKNDAWDNDECTVKVTEESFAGKKAEGEIEKIVKRNTCFLIGTFTKSKNFGFVTPDDKRFEEDIYIQKEHTKGAETGQKVNVRITSYGNNKKKPEGRITEILGDACDPHTDLRATLLAFNIYPEFSMEVIDEAAGIRDTVTESDIKGRLDLRDETVVTIDGADAKDLDDAVSVAKTENGYVLSVHIADVSHYVTEDSALDISARTRGTSVYLINKVIPMLPEKLSNGICSLNAGKDRLTLSCIMNFDKNGELTYHKIDETVINVTRRMTYDEVTDIIETFSDGNEKENNTVNKIGASENSTFDEVSYEAKKKALRKEYGDLIEMFLNMKELSDLLRLNRQKRGAIDFDMAESAVTLDDNDFPVNISVVTRNAASKIIEDFMLAANETVAEDYFWQEIPFLYRTHETPDAEKMTKLAIFVKNFGVNLKGDKTKIHPKEIQKMLSCIKGKEEEALISRLTLRSLKQAKYETECLGHFGLACKYYCHFTSPIRRYPDLQIHRIIKENLNGCLDETRKIHYNEILEDVAKHSSAAERNAESAEREIVRLKHIEYMEGHVGEAFTGVISGVTNWGIYVELENTVEGLVNLASLKDDFYIFDAEHMMLIGEKKHKTFSLGQKVYIEVIAADKLTKTIDFKIIGEKRYLSLTKGEES